MRIENGLNKGGIASILILKNSPLFFLYTILIFVTVNGRMGQSVLPAFRRTGLKD